MKTFEMTGNVPKELNFKTKKDYAKYINSISSNTHSKLTKETKYLITDDLSSDTSKMKKQGS